MNKELYKNKVREFCNLMNVSDLSTKPTAQAIYDRINGRYTDDDMIRSFDEMMEAEVIKLTYPILKRYLTKYKEIRVSADQQRQKMQQKADIDEALSHEQIKQLIDGILNKTNPVPGSDYLKPNSTVRTNDGHMLAVWIDPDDPNLKVGRAVTISYDQRGDYVARVQHIRLDAVKHKILTRRSSEVVAGRARAQGALPVDDNDFIPELELPDAIQESLGLDGQATDHV